MTKKNTTKKHDQELRDEDLIDYIGFPEDFNKKRDPYFPGVKRDEGDIFSAMFFHEGDKLGPYNLRVLTYMHQSELTPYYELYVRIISLYLSLNAQHEVFDFTFEHFIYFLFPQVEFDAFDDLIIEPEDLPITEFIKMLKTASKERLDDFYYKVGNNNLLIDDLLSTNYFRELSAYLFQSQLPPLREGGFEGTFRLENVIRAPQGLDLIFGYRSP